MLISRYKLYFYTFFVTFWIACCWGFVADELLPPLHKLDTARALLVDGVMAVLGLACLRSRTDLGVFLSFIFLSAISSFLLNHEGISFYFNGFRDFIGLLLVVPVLRYFFTSSHSEEFHRSFDKALFVWLCLQAVCITWQFIRYGAGDMGGGSLGEGGSGMTSMMIYVVSFYLLSKRWDASRYWRSLAENKIYVILLYPTFLNETKISLILVVAYFVLLIKFDRKLLLKLTYIVPSGLAVFVGLFLIYASITGQDPEDFLSSELYEEYLYGLDLDELVDIGQRVQDGLIEVDPTDVWQQDIPRFAKIGLMMPILHGTTGGIIFGEGIGQFKGWVTGRTTSFAREYQWLMIGSRPMLFVMLVQMGLAGVIWLLWRLSLPVFQGRGGRPMEWQIRALIALCFLIVMLYNDSLREIVVCTVLFYVLLAVRYSALPEEVDLKE